MCIIIYKPINNNYKKFNQPKQVYIMITFLQVLLLKKLNI